MTKILWLVQAVGNAALAGLVWVWLGLGDAQIWQLALTAVLGLFVVCAALWLHGGTLASFRLGFAGWGRAARSLPWLVLWLVMVVAACWAVVRFGKTAGPWLAPVVVLLFLPPACALSTDGLRGLFGKEGWRPFSNWRFLVLAPVVAASAGFVGYQLIWWVPAVSGLTMQAVSVGLRFGLAYLIVVSAWVAILFFVGRSAKAA
ncbi:MAG: hypothetical protein SFV54_14935 [Bryobacteraceae bacterium]|nr:hypothetical protein [Bryobacteraceae bacterium]